MGLKPEILDSSIFLWSPTYSNQLGHIKSAWVVGGEVQERSGGEGKESKVSKVWIFSFSFFLLFLIKKINCNDGGRYSIYP